MRLPLLRTTLPALVVSTLLAATGCSTSHSPRAASPTTAAPTTSAPTATEAPPTTPPMTRTPTSTPTAAPAPAYPKRFVAVRNARLALIDSHTGALVRYLTSEAPGGGPSEASLLADGTLYFLRGAGTCASSVERLEGDNGVTSDASDTVESAGEALSLAVSPDGGSLAWVHKDTCDKPGTLRIRSTSQDVQTDFELGDPPSIIGTPSWSPDGRYLAAVVQTGTASSVYLYDVKTATAISQAKGLGDPACGRFQPRYRPDGMIVVLTCGPTASQLTAKVIDPAHNTVVATLFTAGVPADSVTSFDLSPDGMAAIYQVGNGPVRIWAPGMSAPVAVPGSATGPTW